MKLGKALATGFAEEQPEARGEGLGQDVERLRAEGPGERVEVREAAVAEEVPAAR
ncbi:hypothetical protein AB0N88_10750 [Streptomyces sp. NPDC093516]|uniref:hypothetical protein n=1 Tax=unclassified Streptomyces TaxID=2593676 RepID=UPI0034331072